MGVMKITTPINEEPITIAKQDILGMESFISQYQHQVRLNAIMNNIGLESNNESIKAIIPTILKDADIETSREMITKLSLSYYENICLSHVLQMHDLILAMVKEIPDCFAVETQGITIMVDGRKVTPAQMLYNLYSLILNNKEKEPRDAKFNEMVNLALDEYEELNKEQFPVSIPCVKSFLVSQFIFFDLTFFNKVIMSNGLMVGDFSSFLDEVGKSGQVPLTQRVNEYLISYYRKLLDILIAVKTELKDNPHDDTEILNKIREAIKPIELKEIDVIVQNNLVSLDDKFNIDHLKEEKDKYQIIWLEVKQILKYIWNKVSSMYSYYNNVYMRHIEDKEDIGMVSLRLDRKIRENGLQGVLEQGPYSICVNNEEINLGLFYLFKQSSKESLFCFQITKRGISFDDSVKVKRTKEFKEIVSSYDGSLTSDQLGKLYLYTIPETPITIKEFGIDNNKYQQLTNLCVDMANNLKEASECKGTFTKLAKAWHDEESASIFNNLDNYGDFNHILKKVEEVFSFNSDSSLAPHYKLTGLLQHITNLHRDEIDFNSLEPREISIVEDTESLLKETNKVITTINMLSNTEFVLPSSYRDKAFVNAYTNFLTIYFKLYRVIVDLWQTTTMDVVTPISLINTFDVKDFEIIVRNSLLKELDNK